MRIFRIRLPLVPVLFLFLPSSASAADPSEPIVLENAALRLEIQKTPSAFVQRLVHRPSRVPLVNLAKPANLFTITIAKPDGTAETIDGLRAGRSSVEKLPAETGEGLVLKYGNFSGADLAVEVTITADRSSPWMLWSIQVENNTGRRLREVRFPQFRAVPAMGDPQDDCLVLPALPGTLIQNPAENWRTGQSVTLNYPGNLSAQFLAYQDPTAGLYLAGMDTEGHPMALGVAKEADGFRLWHGFVPEDDAAPASSPAAGRRCWKSPYPVALGGTCGQWYDTADQYKQWAKRQWWCARTLVQRADIPAWWKAGPDVHVCEARVYDRDRNCAGSYYPKYLDYLRTLRGKIDGPVVAMIAGWENHRRWTAGDYFPVFDADNARRVIGQMKLEGFRPFFYLSGLFYTYWNEGRDAGEIPAAKKYLDAYVSDEKTGAAKEFALNESSPNGTWKRHSYEFCPAAPQTAAFFRGVIDQAHELGVDVLQMDQTVSGAGGVCYSKAHGHTAGPGRYQSQAFWRLLSELRGHGKRQSPDFVLFHEEPHEQLIPYLDGFHVREYKEKFWYRGYPGAIGIPLFSYLYHEYAIGYGGDSAGFSKDNNRWNVRTHAMNLVTGRTPGGSVWSSPQSMCDAHPDQIQVVRNHCQLLKTRAQEFLMLGRMLHPLALAVPELPLKTPVNRGGKWQQEVIPTPAVLTSSWQSPAGGVGHLFVNIAQTAQPLKVAIDTRNVPPATRYDAQIYRSEAGGALTPFWQGVALPKDLSTEIRPLEVIFVELRALP